MAVEMVRVANPNSTAAAVQRWLLSASYFFITPVTVGPACKWNSSFHLQNYRQVKAGEMMTVYLYLR